MEEERAKVCQKWFREEFMKPNNWDQVDQGYPEPILGDSNQNWWIDCFRHEKHDIMINVEAVSEKMGKEAIAWIEGSDIQSQERVPFTIRGGIGASMAARLNHESVKDAQEDSRHTGEIHPLADRMIQIDSKKSS